MLLPYNTCMYGGNCSLPSTKTISCHFPGSYDTRGPAVSFLLTPSRAVDICRQGGRRCTRANGNLPSAASFCTRGPFLNEVHLNLSAFGTYLQYRICATSLSLSTFWVPPSPSPSQCGHHLSTLRSYIRLCSLSDARPADATLSN